VTKYKKQNRWMIEDWIENAPEDLPMHQLWHPSAFALSHYTFSATDEEGKSVEATTAEGWYSSLYGTKEQVEKLIFTTKGRYLKTIFEEIEVMS
jgi:hypothetical protein